MCNNSSVISCRSNSLEALDALLKKGAKPNTTSKYSSCTTLHFAAQLGHRLIVQRLLNDRNLLIDATDQQGMTALQMAISRGYEEICKDLVNKEASITITTAKGQNCLHLAAAGGNSNIASLIIQSGKPVRQLTHRLVYITLQTYNPNLFFHVGEPYN